jgi:hypothetical protein
MRGLAIWAGAAVLVAKLLPAAEADSERAAWRYRRAVRVQGFGELVALTLPPELQGRAQPGLADLRLVNADGQELAYVVDRIETRASASSWSGQLVDERRELSGPKDDERGVTTFVVDLGEPRSFDTIELHVPAQDFAKRVRVEASADREAWALVDADAGIFDGSWGGRVHHTTLAPKAPVIARFLRLAVGDRRGSPPVRITGVTVSSLRYAQGEDWRQPVVLESVPGARPSRYRVEAGLPLETLELDCDDPAFFRRVRLLEVSERAGRPEEKVLGEATLYRLRLPEPGLVGEARVLRLTAPAPRGELVLEVDDADSPPLRNPRAEASGAAVRIVFAATAEPLVLYYGNQATRGPLYDLAALKAQVRFASGLGSVALGEETENPFYRRPEPIPFVALRGSRVEGRLWQAFRRFGIAGAPDICALTLSPPDVALARSDFADLRLVAEDGAQVPYLLETGPSGSVALELEREPARETGNGVASRYGLRVPGSAAGRSQGLSLSALELSIAEAFFERPARLVAPAEPASAERTLYSGTLSRRPSAESGRAGESLPLVIPLDGSRVAELILEIRDGDNAPLSVTGATGRVPLPRLLFKADVGSYRLLLGNPEAAAPRYDLLSLRREVLAYSARPVEASPVEPNPAFRRSAAGYFRDTPPTALLWGALVVAVGALLFVTARMLRPPAPPSGS